ncbi:MAG: DUF3078 domain-containing protein [Bacteroidota bacterium]
MKHTFSLALILTSFLLTAQNTDTTYWKYGGIGSITVSQVSLTNWAAGGQNSAAINGVVGLFADRTKGRGKWENSLDVAYGLIKQGNTDLDKSDDMFNLVTKYGYRINRNSEKWFFSGLLDFRSQFDEGFDPEDDSTLISDFMAPGYLIVSLGVAYDPNEKLSFSYQPLTGKFTFVGVQSLADNGDYGVDPAVRDEDGNVIIPGKNFRGEFGSFLRGKYLTKNFESRLELFTSYDENFGNIDVNWQNSLVVNFTKVLSTNFFTQLIYDDDIKIGADDNGDGLIEEGVEFKPRVQFKSVIGVGLAYRFGEKKE